MRTILVTALGVVLVCIAMVFSVSYNQRQARTLIEDLRQLDKAGDATPRFKAFQTKHRRQQISNLCDDNLCQSEFLISNWTLSSLHLSPRAELRARLTLFHQRASDAGLEFTSYTSNTNNPIVHIQEDFCADRTDIRCDFLALNPHGRNVSPAWNGDIGFGELAKSEEKEAAWNVNLACFTSFHGCKDISALSPRIWKATGAGAVSSCFRSSADSLAEASQPLSEACSVQ